MREFEKKFQFNLALDAEGHLSYLAEGSWRLAHTQELFPEVEFSQNTGIGLRGKSALTAPTNSILLIHPPLAQGCRTTSWDHCFGRVPAWTWDPLYAAGC